MSRTYHLMAGGMRMEDLKLRRQDESFLNGLGAQRIPDPTTAGDFTRRFAPADTLDLMEAINGVRQRVWQLQPRDFLSRAVIDVDGTIAGTLGECKGGMNLSYKGIWGYAPLIVSLANTKEVLYLVNRPGNVPSHDGAVGWIDRVIALVQPRAGQVCLRGDTDFSLTGEFDRWSEAQVESVFGMDAHPKLVAWAQGLPEAHWRGLARGEQVLFDHLRYFFYITNRRDLNWDEVVQFANERGDQENVIAQLKSGVNAMRMPVDNLESNWAYMVMAALAWNWKARYGLRLPNREHGQQIVKMEFRRFLQAIILLPAQIIRSGRQIIYRILGYNEWLKDLFAMWERLRQLALT